MKRLLLLLVFILVVSGCQNEKCNCPKVEVKEENYEEKLENKLIEYAQKIYTDKPDFLSDNYSAGVYSITLNDLSYKYKIDISEFVNKETGKMCDGEKTVVRIFLYYINEDTLEYKIIPKLSCD